MSFTKRVEIRWRDLDGFGHVNNSTYLTYLEEGRDEYLTGILGDAVHRVVVRRLEIDFVSGLTQEDDHVDVRMQLASVGRSSATLTERIVAASDGRVAAESTAVVVHTDDSRTAAAAWPDAERERLEQAAGSGITEKNAPRRRRVR